MMKSKFFSLNAKLALAVLAVGTMFTGCYDSENGDVNKPYDGPGAPRYFVAGTVTDAESGDPLAATVKVDGQSVTADPTSGAYSIELSSAGSKTLTAELEGYEPSGDRTFSIPTDLKNGETYTAVVNIALSETGISDEYTAIIKNIQSYSETKPYTPAEYPGLDLIAEDDPEKIERVFEVEHGYAVSPANVTENAWISQYLSETYGTFGDGIGTIELPYTIELAPWTALMAVNIKYDYSVISYEFSASDAESVNADVTVITGYKFSTQTTPNHDYSYSHGHGHGHGDNINAGGGILTPEM